MTTLCKKSFLCAIAHLREHLIENFDTYGADLGELENYLNFDAKSKIANYIEHQINEWSNKLDSDLDDINADEWDTIEINFNKYYK